MASDAGIAVEEFLDIWRRPDFELARSIGQMTLEELLALTLQANRCYSEGLLKELVAKRVQVKEELFQHMHEEIMPMLEALKAKSILIGLVSNCYLEEAAVIRKSVLLPYFDGVSLSCEEGVVKPDKAIFHRCLERLKVKPEECLYIGDGGSRELGAAQGLGMKALQAAWYLLEEDSQPSKRKSEFEQLNRPLEVIGWITK